MRGFIGFLVTLVLASGFAVGLALLLSTDPLLTRAVQVSAVLALLVQLAGFGCVKYLMRRKLNVFAAWGGAMGVRLISLVTYGVLVFKAPLLGLAVVGAPALMTFVLLLFVTSIVEPIFLNNSNPA